MFDPEAGVVAGIHQFDSPQQAETFAAGWRRRKPAWEIDVVPVSLARNG
jgi:hypothetical protein